MKLPDPSQRLTEHFTLGEMTTTNHRSLMHQNLVEAQGHIDALRATCLLAEKVRALFGRPMIVHSGYRCPALNKRIGGSPRSQHMLGQALDFHVVGVALEHVYEAIEQSGIPLGQCILEGYRGHHPSWLHLSLGYPWRPREKSMQFFRLQVDP